MNPPLVQHQNEMNVVVFLQNQTVKSQTHLNSFSRIDFMLNDASTENIQSFYNVFCKMRCDNNPEDGGKIIPTVSKVLIAFPLQSSDILLLLKWSAGSVQQPPSADTGWFLIASSIGLYHRGRRTHSEDTKHKNSLCVWQPAQLSIYISSSISVGAATAVGYLLLFLCDGG